MDKEQAEQFELKISDFNKRLKIIDFESGLIGLRDFKHIPMELQSDFGLKMDRRQITNS